MGSIIDRIMRFVEAGQEDQSELEQMKMRLGFEIMFHNLVMISCILMIAGLLDIFDDAVILLAAYGSLKLTTGGLHFQKSSVCLLSTCAFIVCGSFLARYMEISLRAVLALYFICMILLWCMGPQGTHNNPIYISNYKKLRKYTIVVACLYVLITLYRYAKEERLPYQFLVAMIFETATLLPCWIRNRSCRRKKCY